MSRIVTVSLSKSGALAKLACLATLASCGHVDYENAPAGKFSGSLFVMWIDDGGALGDGTFVYVPHPDQPQKFTRTAQGSVRTIKPQMMYTDGGSIPRIAQVFQGFNPWGYAPAYIVHDWLFVARQCNTDGLANTAEEKVANVTFQESAEIIAEAIKTLVEARKVKPNDVAPRVISSTVASPVARQFWNKKGACRDPRLSEDDRLAAEAGIPGSSKRLAPQMRTLDNGQSISLKAGQVVGEIRF